MWKSKASIIRRVKRIEAFDFPTADELLACISLTVALSVFLRAKGWKPGQPYQEGTHNFRVLNEWNAATVYQ